jgi:hypothetical protein
VASNVLREDVPIAQLMEGQKQDGRPDLILQTTGDVPREDMPIAQLLEGQKQAAGRSVLTLQTTTAGVVLQEDVPIAQLADAEQKKQNREPDLLLDVRRDTRECLSSIFLGVRPFWQGGSLLYKFRVQVVGKSYEYGKYGDENVAALARDYATRRIISLTGGKHRSFNSKQFVFEDDAEKECIDKWLEGILSGLGVRQKQLHGVHRTIKEGEYRVRLLVGGALLDFGTYPD